jgi:hypothetical protein
MEQPNLTYLHSLSGGDKIFEKQLITIIKSEYPQEKAIYYKNFQEGNFKMASENVHKLKHKISILGLEESYETAVTFENNLLEGSTDLSEDFKSILDNITVILNTL